MPNKSKRKGNSFERELVQQAQAAGLDGYRCWGSDGRSRGLGKDVDLVLTGAVKLQAKRKAKLPEWLGLTNGVDGVVLRQDHGEAVVVLRWADYLALLKAAGANGACSSPGPCPTPLPVFATLSQTLAAMSERKGRCDNGHHT
jgi:hypothetical protein